MAKTMTTKGATEAPKPIKAQDRVVFTWNGKDKFHKEGQTSSVHPEFAKKMKAKGLGDYNADKVTNKSPLKKEAVVSKDDASA